jgi:hypothetical protein
MMIETIYYCEHCESMVTRPTEKAGGQCEECNKDLVPTGTFEKKEDVASSQDTQETA